MLTRLVVLVALVLFAPLSGCGKGAESSGQGSDSTATADNASSEDEKSDKKEDRKKKDDGEDEKKSEDEEKEEEEDEKKAAPDRAVSVNASPVVRGELVIPVIAEGTVRARKQTQIRAEVGGRIETIDVQEGDRVKKGQRIAQVDDRDYQIALSEAKSRYLEALGKLAVDGTAEPNPEASKQLQEKLKELESQEQKGEITAEERRSQALELEVEAVRAGAHRDELVQVRSGLAAARAGVERADLDLERTRITAPFAGVVSNLTLTPGERVTVEAVICDLIDNVNIEAQVAVLESDLAGLEVGRPALLEVPALGESLRVSVDVLSPDIDTESRTCPVLLRFQSEDGRVRPGMYVRAFIAGEIHQDRLMVPREAILTRDGRPLLFKISNDRTEWVYVEIGLANDRFVEIARVLQGGPLDPGTLVVVSDHLTLTHQAKVKVKEVVEPASFWASSQTQSP